MKVAKGRGGALDCRRLRDGMGSFEGAVQNLGNTRRFITYNKYTYVLAVELKQSQPAQLIGKVSMIKTFLNASALAESMASPSIACIGIIGKLDNPLHISIFPPHEDSRLELSLLLNSCLDLVEIRRKHTSVDQDLGLLHAFDERFAAYGWLTNTNVKFLIIVDMDGNVTSGVDKKKIAPLAFRALQTAYIKLLQNPFHQADDTNPVGRTTMFTEDFKTANNQFIREIQMIGRG
ncbi:hypothetical protein ACJ73_07343, partial [Blastomyces percursus]